jgi:hypothetical protein
LGRLFLFALIGAAPQFISFGMRPEAAPNRRVKAVVEKSGEPS